MSDSCSKRYNKNISSSVSYIRIKIWYNKAQVDQFLKQIIE